MIIDIEDAIFPIGFVIIICSAVECILPNVSDTIWNRDAC